jgi:predicted Zn-dependent protease
MLKWLRGRTRCALLILAAICLSSCVTSERSGNPLFDASRDPVFVPLEQEKAIGLQSAQAVAKRYKVSGDASLRAYVASMGQKLAAVSDRRDLAYTFTLLDDPMVNAFALPGGYVYVTTGILKNLEDEAGLAAVMGHEIGHVVRQHGVKNMQRQVAASVGMDLLLGMLSEDKARFVAAFAGPATSLLFLRNGREAELEADEQGMQNASRAGYDPAAMIGVQQMLLKQTGKADPLFGDMLADHPASEGRIEQAQALLPKFRGPSARGAERYRQEVLGRLK